MWVSESVTNTNKMAISSQPRLEQTNTDSDPENSLQAVSLLIIVGELLHEKGYCLSGHVWLCPTIVTKVQSQLKYQVHRFDKSLTPKLPVRMYFFYLRTSE